MNKKEIIKRAKEKYKLGARRLEKVIELDCGIHIPHNRIHQHLLKEGLAKEESKKQKRRKSYIRYEREHTMSAGHSDWYDSGFNNTKFCTILDDALRKILVAGRGTPEGGYR